TPNAVAGTSGGAIVAALLALGKTAADMQLILSKTSIVDPQGKDNRERFDRLKDAGAELRDVMVKYRERAIGWRDLGKVRRLYNKVRESLLGDLSAVWSAKGFHH